MRVLIFRSLVFSGVLFFAVSCNNGDWTPDESQVQDGLSVELAKFRGLSVNHQRDAPVEVLTYSLEDFQNELLDKGSNHQRNLKTLSDFDYPTLDQLAEISVSIEANYPNVYRPTPEEASIIRNDFPELTDQEIEENLDTIEEYYEQNMTYDILQVLAQSSFMGENSRTADYPGGLCDKEFWILAGRPRATRSVQDATDNANSATNKLYTSAGGYTRHLDRGDAFRHAYWNALIAAYYGAKKDDIQKGLQLAKEFADAHEECAESSPSYQDYDNEMDYHNNWVGRVVFGETSEYRVIGSWPFRRTVVYTLSDQSFVDNIKLKADNALKAVKSMAGVDAVRGNNLIYFQGP